MKKLVLLLALVCVSVSFARPNSYTNMVFGGGFGGAAFNDYEYSVPVGSEVWAGFSNSDASIYPHYNGERGTSYFSSEISVWYTGKYATSLGI